MEIIEIDRFRGIARISDVKREVNLMLVPEVKLGDYVIIHAGAAISILSQEEAKKTLDLLRQIQPPEGER
jgi:hydrogenase expression/formation protein HypC